MTARARLHFPKILPIAILAVAALVTLALVRSRPAVEVTSPPVIAPLVRVVTATPGPVRLDVDAQGTVLPRTETVLVARVAGTVTRVAEVFENGGFFTSGQILLELDRRDYELVVRRAEANVAQAELRLVLEQAEAEVARAEWQRLGEPGNPGPLVVREPQVAQSRAALQAAIADLEKARLDLERTRVRAPFDGRLRRKQADIGQFLTPGAPIASIHSTDYAEIRLPVADDQLAFLELPFLVRTSRAEPGPTVRLDAHFAGTSHSWFGSIVRTEGELDPRTRMINLVARVERPYEVSNELGTAPLTIGLFVNATIEGRTVAHAFSLPRDALRQDDTILIVDDDSRLRTREIDVIKRESEVVIVASGLESGELVCVSPLDIVTEGMRVRTVNEDGNSREGEHGDELHSLEEPPAAQSEDRS